eukprot:5896025-Karenia_brevis.AAC.1
MGLVGSAVGTLGLGDVLVWIISSANGDKQYSPVAYHGENGTMDGRQTVPRAEMTAVIRALLH